MKLPPGGGDGSSAPSAALAAAGAGSGAAEGFGRGLRPGEGAAIAAFVEAGQRVPRRGEVGWDSGQIDRLEAAGFVMSGSRHKRMTEVRLRKESQVYSAEERRALALFNYEEKAAREARLLEEFRAMLAVQQQQTGAGAEAPDAAPPPSGGR